MTADKNRKRAVRARMAQTGEPYSVAARSIAAAPTAQSTPVQASGTKKPAAANKPRTFGPKQILDYLGMSPWQWERASVMGLIAGPDVDGRWSQDFADGIRGRLRAIHRRIGSQPDIGAYRAAEYLSDRLGVEVTTDAVKELGRRRLIGYAGDYKGSQLYSGLDLERFTDVSVIPSAVHDGRRRNTEEATEYLEVRPSDFAALLDIGWLVPVEHVDSSYGRKGNAQVALYRTGDLDALLADPAIPWDAFRAVKKGGKSLVPSVMPRDLDELLARDRRMLPGLKADVKVLPRLGVVAVKTVKVPPKMRGEGITGAVFGRILAWADRNGYPVVATAAGFGQSSYGSAIPPWLRDRGFRELDVTTEIDVAATTSKGGYSMVRHPSACSSCGGDVVSVDVAASLLYHQLSVWVSADGIRELVRRELLPSHVIKIGPGRQSVHYPAARIKAFADAETAREANHAGEAISLRRVAEMLAIDPAAAEALVRDGTLRPIGYSLWGGQIHPTLRRGDVDALAPTQ
jgi:hypothetical protein